MNTKTLFVAAAVSFMTACASHGVARDINGVRIVEEKAGLWSRATLSPDSAIKIALALVPGGRVTKGELEEEDGRLIYSLDLTVPGKSGEDEVHVDANTGAVVKHEHEG